MNYKTSKDYKRLYHLLYVEKQDVFGSSIMGFEFAQKNPETKVDPYYRRYECFRHNMHGEMTDVFGNPCFEQSLELFCSFCQKNDVDFIDPADYPVCVQPEPECRLQTALRLAYRTQRRSVWHDCEDIPEDFNHDVIAVTINGTWARMPVCDLRAFLSGLQHLMIRRWAYIDDLEAL